MKYKKLIILLGFISTSCCLAITTDNPNNTLKLQDLAGFFRFNFDNITMPEKFQNMGLFGINYFANITPNIYGGVGAYGSIRGGQGGLFTLGLGGGFLHKIGQTWSSDLGMYVGGGGGRSSLVGGGLILRPYIGINYIWQPLRFGLYYNYVTFPSGKIHSQQIGIDLDMLANFYYLPASANFPICYDFRHILLPKGRYLNFQRNDFMLLLQMYPQKRGTKNVNGELQDGTIALVGAELDHYVNDKFFWSIKTAGAFHGIPNGYMDVIGGLGYRHSLGIHTFAIIPQVGIGAGGGGEVNTGGGVLVQFQLSVESPIISGFSGRISGGYLRAPGGSLRAWSATGALVYHLNIAGASTNQINYKNNVFFLQNWSVQLLNQTYLRPQRAADPTTTMINLVGVQVDQLITQNLFFSYQAASAYSGWHSGGLATGMIGPGIQSSKFAGGHLQLFASLLIGAAGGGRLAVASGSLVEPIIGFRYHFTQSIGLQSSFSQIKAFRHKLNTPALNVGLILNFDTINLEISH